MRNSSIPCGKHSSLNILDFEPNDFSVFSTKDPVYREEEEAYMQWWSKTPLARRKQRVLEMEAEARG